MDKAKTSQGRAKSSRKSKSKGFDIHQMDAVTLKKGLKFETHDPKKALSDLNLISAALIESLMDGDVEAFKEILTAHLNTMKKDALAKSSGVSLRTIFRMLEPGSNPTLNNLAKVFHALRAFEKPSKKQEHLPHKKAA